MHEKVNRLILHVILCVTDVYIDSSLHNCFKRMFRRLLVLLFNVDATRAAMTKIQQKRNVKFVLSALTVFKTNFKLQTTSTGQDYNLFTS